MTGGNTSEIPRHYLVVFIIHSYFYSLTMYWLTHIDSVCCLFPSMIMDPEGKKWFAIHFTEVRPTNL